MNTWLLKLSLLLLLSIAFFAPIKIPNSAFIGKEIGLWLSIGITILFASIKFWLSENTFDIKVVDIAVTVFLIVIPVSFSLIDSFQNTPKILISVALGFVYISSRVFASGLKKNVCVNIIIECTTTILMVQMLIALGQQFNVISHYAPGISITGMFFNSGPFAIFTMALTIINWSLFLVNVMSGNKRYAIFHLIIFIIACNFILLSLSRSAWLGGIIGILVSSTFLFLNHYRIKIFSVIIPAHKLLLSSVGLGAIPFSIWIYTLKESSVSGRLLIWEASASLIKDYWMMGVGTGNFASYYINYQAKVLEKMVENVQLYNNIAGDTRFSFNDMINFFGENGILSLILFVFLCFKMVSILYVSIKQNRKSDIFFGTIILSPLVVIIVSGLTSYPLTIIPIAILFWSLYGIMISMENVPNTKIIEYSYRFKVFTTSLLVIVGTMFLAYGTLMYKKYVEFGKVKSIPNAMTKIKELNSLYTFLSYDAIFLEELAMSNIEGRNYRQAISNLERAIKLSPYKELYFNLGYCYEQLGDFDMAKQQYMLIQKAIPNLIRPRFLLAKLEYNRGNIDLFKKLASSTMAFQPKVESKEVYDLKQELNLLLVKVNMIDKSSSKKRIQL